MSALMLPLSFDESKSESAMGSRNETGNKPILNEVIDANLVEVEFSLNKVSFHLNAELLVSSSLHGENCSEEILGDGCSRSLFHFESCSMPTTNENGNASSFPKTYYTRSSVSLDTPQRNAAINKKRRARKSQSQEAQKLAMCPSLIKYWHQRYSLFSRYDEGIKMDEESWFSVTPELIAQHHAFRCGSGTIIDCFTGVGGNAIQFAKRGSNVIAVDVDPKKIDYAQHNAIIYGVSDRIKFIKDDFFKIAPNLKGDVVFLAPPWGGPDYVKLQTYDIRSLKPRDGYQLFKIASMIAAKVVMFLPRNVNLAQLEDLSLLVDPPWSLEVEQNYLCGRLKSTTAYFVRPHEIRL